MQKKLLAAVAVAAVGMLHAVEFTMEGMPISSFADTEVSTNMPINKADISYADLKFSFDGTPSNNLELAFGTDGNTNGVLEAGEIDASAGGNSIRTMTRLLVHGLAVSTSSIGRESLRKLRPT